MNFTFFIHSLVSDWNHGNAHFVRGVLADLTARGHSIRVFEPRQSWSRQQLVADQGFAAARAYRQAYPDLSSQTYDETRLDDAQAARWLANQEAVVVHEWTAPRVVAALGRAHRNNPDPRRRLLFHDTHHRCVSAPEEMQRFDLQHYDGVLAFGQVIRDWYLEHHDLPAWTWHEAADTNIFTPRPDIRRDADLVWIGNWGDDERSEELHEYLIRPVTELGLNATVYGVRYPRSALQTLKNAGITYGGYLPNHRVPEVFARHRVTVHVPRRFYRRSLPGIPTIRPFEALACGIPLVSAPWSDAEGLFDVGRDFEMVSSGREMTQRLGELLSDPKRRDALAAHGRETIHARHTCTHRVDELFDILDQLNATPEQRVVAEQEVS